MSEKLLSQILEEIKSVKDGQKMANKKLGNVEDKIISIENRLDNIENKLGATIEQTAKLSEYHSEVMNKLENVATKEDLIYYDMKLGVHEKEIFNLKMRQ